VQQDTLENGSYLFNEQGHHVFCCTRDTGFISKFEKNITVIEVDFLKQETLSDVPNDIAAYYLMHSMSSSSDKFDQRNANFVQSSTTLMYNKSYTLGYR
jgi:hypothetical protein